MNWNFDAFVLIHGKMEDLWIFCKIGQKFILIKCYFWLHICQIFIPFQYFELYVLKNKTYANSGYANVFFKILNRWKWYFVTFAILIFPTLKWFLHKKLLKKHLLYGRFSKFLKKFTAWKSFTMCKFLTDNADPLNFFSFTHFTLKPIFFAYFYFSGVLRQQRY